MINGSFVFGMDDDDESVFRAHGRLGDRARNHDGDVSHSDAVSWHAPVCPHGGRRPDSDARLGSVRHQARRLSPARLTPEALKEGYDWAYREFYRWSSIARGSLSHGSIKHQAKHFFYAAGWKKFEPLWDVVIRARQLRIMTPMLEGVLSRVTARDTSSVATAGGNATLSEVSSP